MRNNDEDESPVPDTENQRMVPITFGHAMPPSKPYNYINGYQRTKDSDDGTVVAYGTLGTFL